MRLIRTINGDHLTPITIYLRLKDSRVLLESDPAAGGKNSIIGIAPADELTFKDGIFNSRRDSFLCGDPLKELEKYVRAEDDLTADLPFQGGAIGYAGYDVAACYEDIGELPPDELGIADLDFYLFETFLIYDHEKELVSIICSNAYSQVGEAELKRRMADILAELMVTNREETKTIPAVKFPYTSNFSKEGFEKVVAAAKELIDQGDLFQMVPSQRLKATMTLAPFDYYRQLRKSNPSEYMYYLDFGETKVIGTSPESLVTVRNGRITTNPIAGTRKRGMTPEEDDILASELLADEKERAEHMMLVDLSRNDLSKVAEIGSVAVTSLMTIEKYRYVMHICSLVEGCLEKGQTPMDALKATLPVGTVSGAPKIRAMQRIYQFETVRRNLYAGAVGYYSLDEQADFAIAIRTMVVKEDTAYVQAGAGIVYDSVPEKEYYETLHKAKALLEVSR